MSADVPRLVSDAMVNRPKTLPATATVTDVRTALASDHVHLVLIVDEAGRLLTTIDRGDLGGVDLDGAVDDGRAARSLGTLTGRVIDGHESLASARMRLDADGGRRLAVVHPDGTLVGLLCLKRGRHGYCSDQDVEARARDRAGLATLETAWSTAQS